MAKKVLITLAHAFIGWLLCGMIMGIGRKFTSVENALIIHAIGAPVVFSFLSIIYFRNFNYTSPIFTAIIFVGFVILMDLLVIAPLVEHSFEMFKSMLGTWIPFGLIFLSAYMTSLCCSSRGKSSRVYNN